MKRSTSDIVVIAAIICLGVIGYITVNNKINKVQKQIENLQVENKGFRESVELEGANEKVTPSPEEITVYITKTGKKYQRAGCQYLRKSSVPISLKRAREAGYKPCSLCNPPSD